MATNTNNAYWQHEGPDSIEYSWEGRQRDRSKALDTLPIRTKQKHTSLDAIVGVHKGGIGADFVTFEVDWWITRLAMRNNLANRPRHCERHHEVYQII